MTSETAQVKAQALVAAVRRSIKIPADRASLRRGVGFAPEHYASRGADRIVARLLPANTDRATEWAFYAVAALMAAQPRDARDQEAGPEDQPVDSEPGTAAAAVEKRNPVNLGRTLGQAVNDRKLAADTTEMRLHLLCRQDLAGLHRHLPRLVAHLRSDLVPIDWAKLTIDLSRWDTQRDRVAKDWLQDFHRVRAAAENAKAKADSASSESENQ